MFSDPNLDSPPPRSQFRRPWSPEQFDSGPYNNNNYDNYPGAGYTHQQWRDDDALQLYNMPSSRRQRREASDASVEALDLADYARTLRARQAEDPYPPFPAQMQPQDSGSSSIIPSFPPLANARDSLAMHPPSLISRGPTLSSNSTHHSNGTHHTNRTHNTHSSPHTHTHSSRGSRRPFSLPVTPSHSSQPNLPRRHPPSSFPNRTPYIADPEPYRHSSDEIDISSFPKWSRGWYNNSGRYGNHNADPDADLYSPLPPAHSDSTRQQKMSPFDPAYVHSPDPYDSYDIPPPRSSYTHESARDLLPWSSDPPDYGPPIDAKLKEERMRMLEQEFGNSSKSKNKGNSKLLVDEEGTPLPGTVDENGNLVSAGPKRRIAFRILQIVFAIGAAVPAIYAAIAIKSKDPRFPPPPANKPPAFVLYAVSCMTLVLLLYLFVIRPCCCVRSKSKSGKHQFGPANMGMMVLPVGPGGKKKKAKGKKGKGKYGPQGGPGDVQVNLIVDPNAFQPPDDDGDSDEDGYDSNEDNMPGGYGSNRRKKRNQRRRRRGVFEGLAMEEEWRVARAWAKKLALVDVVGIIVWAAVFVFLMIGERCPMGDFDGWCNAYNVSTASACLLCVAFGVSTFFDVQDLYASKQSPRTRV